MVMSDSQEQFPPSSACRADEGQGMCVFIDLYVCIVDAVEQPYVTVGSPPTQAASACILVRPVLDSQAPGSRSGLFVIVALSEPWQALFCKILSCHQQLATPEALMALPGVLQRAAAQLCLSARQGEGKTGLLQKGCCECGNRLKELKGNRQKAWRVGHHLILKGEKLLVSRSDSKMEENTGFVLEIVGVTSPQPLLNQ